MENNDPADGKLTAGTHISYWTDTVKAENFSSLIEDLETDVVVVGGGIGGVTTAYCLAKSGKKVVLVEDGLLGSGETGRTSAHLTVALDAEYYELEKTFGEEKTRLIAKSHQQAIDFIEQTAKAENIECDFKRVDGFLFIHPSDEKSSLGKEKQAALKAGVEVEEINHVPGLLVNGNGLRFSNQAIFHPLKYITGLAKAAEKLGVKIFTETHADKIDHHGITTNTGHQVKAKHIVVATNSPVNNKVAMHLKQNGFMTYVIGALVKKGTVPQALWWDSGDSIKNPDFPPYHYVRTTPYDDQHDLLISGGEDHPLGDTSVGGLTEQHRYAALESWTRRHFKIEEVIYQWSGEVMETIDNIGFMGRNPWDKDNVYIITGDCGDGLTSCTIGGLLITDLINGKENELEKIYSPSRMTISKIGVFFKGLLQGMIPDKKKAAWETHKNDLDAVKQGMGTVMELHGEKCGVFRDESDHLHIVSAKCTHLGCAVTWNNDEKCWDCPCHGSRFTCDGKVIHGPANSDLPSYTYTGQDTVKIERP